MGGRERHNTDQELAFGYEHHIPEERQARAHQNQGARQAPAMADQMNPSEARVLNTIRVGWSAFRQRAAQ